MIFLGGVHGVGKTSMCKQVAEKIGLEFFSAGFIIKQEKVDNFLDSRTIVDDIDFNQSLLLKGIQKIKKIKNELFIIDGHFSLIQKNEGVKPISLDVFLGIGIKFIILINDDPSLISNRLFNRDKLFYSTDDINLFQAYEENNAKYISTSMGIPLYTIKAFDYDALFKCLDSILSRR